MRSIPISSCLRPGDDFDNMLYSSMDTTPVRRSRARTSHRPYYAYEAVRQARPIGVNQTMKIDWRPDYP